MKTSGHVWKCTLCPLLTESPEGFQGGCATLTVCVTKYLELIMLCGKVDSLLEI